MSPPKKTVQPEMHHYHGFSWSMLTKMFPHSWEHLRADVAVLIIVVGLGVWVYKVWRGDVGELQAFETIMQRSDERHRETTSLIAKMFTTSIDKLGAEVAKNTAAVDNNSAIITRSIAGRTFISPKGNKKPDAKSPAEKQPE